MQINKFLDNNYIKLLNSNNKVYFKNAVIHQPNLFPNIKVLQKICSGDIWIILDDAQFVRREWQNRCKIRFFKKPDLEFWINLQVKKADRYEKIKNIKIYDYNKFKQDVNKKVYHAYGYSKNWNFINNYMTEIFLYDFDYLSDFCVFSVLKLFELLEIKINVLFSSEYNLKETRSERLVELCKKVHATNYISGLGGHNYMNNLLFEKENINISWHQWDNPSYEKNHDNLNWRNISFIDFIARYGHTCLKQYILNGKNVLTTYTTNTCAHSF